MKEVVISLIIFIISSVSTNAQNRTYHSYIGGHHYVTHISNNAVYSYDQTKYDEINRRYSHVQSSFNEVNNLDNNIVNAAIQDSLEVADIISESEIDVAKITKLLTDYLGSLERMLKVSSINFYPNAQRLNRINELISALPNGKEKDKFTKRLNKIL